MRNSWPPPDPFDELPPVDAPYVRVGSGCVLLLLLGASGFVMVAGIIQIVRWLL